MSPLDALLPPDHPLLRTPAEPVHRPDDGLADEFERLHATLAAFRAERGFGRAISAPQVGVMKRLVAMQLGATPFALVNPRLTWTSEATVELWDDCLSLPDRVVRVRRHRSVDVEFEDERGRTRRWRRLPPDMAELVQHELDHLDGVLMTDRATGDDPVRPIAERASLVGADRPAPRLRPAAVEPGDAFDAVTVPLGNGALLNGIACWLKAASPATRTIGVSASGADAMEKSWRSGRIVTPDRVDSIADGIAVRVPIPEALTDMRGLVDDVLLVDDAHVLEAMRLLYRHAGLLIEPAGRRASRRCSRTPTRSPVNASRRCCAART